MSSKSGFKILALSCIMLILLILGATSNGYCKGGLQPPTCQDTDGDGIGPDPSLKGPAMQGTLTFIEDVGFFTAQAVFDGKCQQTQFQTLPVEVQATTTERDWESLTAEDLENQDFSADIIPATCNKPGTRFNVSGVTSFERPFPHVIIADVIMMWWVCPNTDHTSGPPGRN